MTQYEQMSREELIRELRDRDNSDPYRTSLMAMREAYFLAEIIYDTDGDPCNYRYLDTNPSFEQMVRLPRQLIVGRRRDEVLPQPSPFWLHVFRQVASSGIPSYSSFYSETLDSYFEVFALRPAPGRYAVLITDITERRAADQALLESEARLRLFIEHAPASLAMFDRDMNYLCATRRWMDAYALGEADLKGVSHYDVFPEISDNWREVHRRALAGEVLTSDGEPFTRSDGRVHWESWKVRPWYDGHGAIGGVVIMTEDISGIKETEEKLRTSEQRYRDIVENQTEYVDRYLPGGILTFVNNSLASVTGKMPEELVGISYFPFVYEEDRAELIRTIESLSAENPTAVFENRVQFPDGLHWMQWKHCALTDCDGNIVEYQATGRDVTELKQMQDAVLRQQQELQAVNELLEQRVHERTAELEAAITAQESFSYSVSHDLRAPLRHINSFSAMLMEDFGDTLPPQARDYLDRICAASSRMGELIDHLLELSRVTRARINPAVVNLSDIAAAALRTYQKIEPGRPTETEVELGVTVLGDPSLLRQLLENLLENAWKYTSKTMYPRIQFGRTAVDGQDAYFVRDNGAGFDMAYSKKLFQPFERLHGPEFEGIGIGLATAQRIVQRHGGTIRAEGGINQGATFYFTLHAAS
jgi:PAS domain S-box-containing protein